MKKGWQWPLLVIASLGFTVGVNVVMLFASGADPNGTVVEPDYYRKAVDWDRTMSRRAASAALGWSARAAFTPASADTRALTVTVRDSSGTLVTDAAVRVTLIHNLQAARPLDAALTRQDDGTYAATVSAPRSGLWEVRVEARRGDERFATTLHTDAP